MSRLIAPCCTSPHFFTCSLTASLELQLFFRLAYVLMRPYPRILQVFRIQTRRPIALSRAFSICRPMAQEYKIKDLSSLDLLPGAKKEVEVEGIENGKVLLVNVKGKIQAVGAKCTHYGAPLVKGVLTSEGRLTCPWHGGTSPCLIDRSILTDHRSLFQRQNRRRRRCSCPRSSARIPSR